jgi:hypothetical protein
MLAFAHSAPASRRQDNLIADITRAHELFAATADDPEWGRRTERALQDYFHARSAHGALEITSIACRSAGCEVMAEVRPTAEFFDTPAEDHVEEPTFLDAEGRTIPDDPRAPLREKFPIGESLRLSGALGSRVGNRMGFIVSYRRIDRP